MLSLKSTKPSTLQVIQQWAHLHANQYAYNYQKSADITCLMVYMQTNLGWHHFFFLDQIAIIFVPGSAYSLYYESCAFKH